ncbi:hypothetical protein C5E19_09355 [Pectobacterium parmentieri]|nr:hypothetical protein C5E26_09920 [Pectobacterium parmentieri]AYH27496.1 hypothetical protein C5E20_10325 [Pectobacterium parmentieri]AYH31800.1 hypothetical protein C5E19_09355 [Pectobacterium parmentieri]
MRDILSLTGGQPLAGQIRSRRICPSLAALRCSWLSIALKGQRFALFKTLTFCPENRIIWSIYANYVCKRDDFIWHDR